MNSREKSDTLFSHILLIYLISRVLLEAIGLLSLFYFPSARTIFKMRDLAYHQPVSPFAEMWARWDSEWFLLLADHGYDSYEYFKDAGGGRYQPADMAKFPLYSWLIRFFSLATGNSLYSGLLVSNISALLFFYYLFKLAEKILNSEEAAQACLFYIFFPTSFFLNAVYSEALFLACIAACFYYLEQGKIVPAMLAAGLSVLCRASGVLAVPALLWMTAIRFPQHRVRSVLLLLLAIGVGLSIYMFAVWRAFGDVAAIVAQPNYWRGETKYPLYAFVRFFSNPIAIHGQHNSLVDFSFAVMHLLALVFSFRRIPGPYVLYSAAAVLVPLSSSLFAFARLGLVNFPFFLYLALQLKGRWAFIVQFAFAMLLAFFMAAFANWYWVG